MHHPFRKYRHAILFLGFVLLSFTNYAQEDCFNGVDDDGDGLIDLNDKDCSCVLVTGQDTVWGDFEDYTCCPSEPSGNGNGIECLESWTSASNGSTDYYNTCDLVEAGSVVLPLPPASGEGAVGFISLGFYAEYVGLCMESVLICDNTYTISFAAGFNSGGWLSNSPFTYGIYGTTSCDNFPAPTDVCPADLDGWTELGTVSVSGVPDGWTYATFDFVPTTNIEAIAIGAACSELSGLSQYHFIDDVIISGVMGNESLDPSEIELTGDCETQVEVSIEPISGATYQWYLNGIAIPGANSSTYLVPGGGDGDGLYTVLVDDGTGCGTSGPIPVLVEEDVLDITAHTENPACSGDDTGLIDLELPTANPPFVIEWSTGESTEVIDNLPAGSYTVTITDANGCFGIETFIITEPNQALSGQIINIQQPVGSATEGSAEVMMNSGYPPYTYLWDNGETTPVATMLLPGVHSVTVTDFNGCEIVLMVTIGEPLVFSASIISLECIDSCFGSIELSVSGGLPPFTFDWNTGESGPSISNLCSGMYTVTMTDDFGTELIQEFTIDAPPPILITSDFSDMYCYDATGYIDLNVSGGVPDYQYSWSTGQTSEDIFDLTSDEYSVTVTDANGCQNSTEFYMEVIPPTEIFGDITHEDCGGGGNGTIDISLDGFNPYSFDWSNGSTDEDLVGLTSGVYDVIVTDVNGCTTTAMFIVSQAGNLDVSTTISHASCNGVSDGSISVNVTEGTPPYDYAWSTGQTTPEIDNIEPGNYTVTITDSGGCVYVDIYSIEEGEGPTTIATISDLSCFGFDDGSILLEVTSGTPPYDFTWSNGSISSFNENLPTGNYEVTITDAFGCVSDSTFSVDSPSQLGLNGSWTSESCSGMMDGTAEVIPSGGIEPYSFLWSNGETTSNNTGLAAGTYSITITDANGCTENLNITVTANPGVIISGTTTSASCNGGTDGSIDASVADGVSPYGFLWSTGQMTEDISGLSAGNYTLTVTDANGCQDTMTFNVDGSGTISVQETIQQLLCYGDNDATIDLNVMGGTPPYQFLWSHGPNTQNVIGLVAGDYEVTVTDDQGCQVELNFTINDVLPIILTPSIVDVDCNENMTGSIELSVSGGSTPYSFQWSNGSNSSTNGNLSAGTYDLTVTDASGCSATGQYQVTEPPALEAVVVSITHPTMVGEFGSAEISVIGGTAPYSISWSNGETGAIAVQLGVGTTSITITDAKGCAATTDITIAVEAFSVNYTIQNNTCFGDCLGEIVLDVQGGLPPYSIDWSNGQSGLAVIGLCNGNYSATITDGQGALVEINTLDITSAPALTIASEITGISCFDNVDGSIATITSGGIPPYQYIWNTGSNMSNISDLPPGVFSLTVTDAVGCEVIDLFELTNIISADMSVTFTNIDCNNPSGTLTISGDNPIGYLILVNDLPVGIQEAIEIGDLGAGDYIVEYEAAPDCLERIDSIRIEEKSNFAIAIDPIFSEITFGSEVEIYLSVAGTVTNQNVDWTALDEYDCIEQDSLGNCIAISITPETDQVISVLVVDEYGCEATTSSTIQVVRIDEIYIPNVFSPNGDGVNDVFKPFSSSDDQSVRSFKVFSRWGEEVYAEEGSSINSLMGWDGSYNHHQALPGVYVYAIEIILADGSVEVRSGDVTIVR